MPRYRAAVLVAPRDVRRVRSSVGFTVTRFALELGVDRRTIQRWEVAGAVLERVPSLLMEYGTSTLGRLERVAELAELEMELLRPITANQPLIAVTKARQSQAWLSRDAPPDRVARFFRPRHFSSIAEKRPRKTAKATRSGRGPLRRHGGKTVKRPAGYKLEGREPVAVDDVLEWATWFEANRCSDVTKVGRTNLADCYVSTVFLGLDHNFSHVGAPLLFETLVFGGRHDGEMRRYSTWADAEAGHAAMLERVK